jgi:RNA polymerase primary sigma factor
MIRENRAPLSVEFDQKAGHLNLTAAQKQEFQRILAKSFLCIPHPSFRHPKQMEAILQQSVEVIPATPLDRDGERTLFLQMNYARYRVQDIRRQMLKERRWRKRDIVEILKWNQAQQTAQDKIVASNMGLVLSMAKRIRCDGIEFTELISEGSMALLRAVGGYDCDRGFKFSTYACKVILRKYSRVVKKQYAYQKVFPVAYDPQRETGDAPGRNHDRNLEDWTQEVQYVLRENLAELSQIEQSVIRLRFSLDHSVSGAMTLKQVGEKLGLTKERIRQIQLKALAKLREATEERMVAV